MKPSLFYSDLLVPALEKVATWTNVASDARARVQVMAIAGQESGWEYRRQLDGPARSYWQFERFGGVAEVMQKCPKQLGNICRELDIPYDSVSIFEAMAWNDVLAAGMARLLVWQDPAALPALGQRDEAWEYYKRNWRPGMPHPEVWPSRYGEALALVNTSVQP